MARFIQWFPTGVSHISLWPHKIQPREWKEEQWTHTDLFCVKLLQKPLGMPTHLWLSSLTAFFCWLSLPWTAISRWLSSSALHCRLHLSVFLCQLTLCLLWDLPYLRFRSCGRSQTQTFVWVSCQSRQRDSLTGAHTHTPNTMNGLIVSH